MYVRRKSTMKYQLPQEIDTKKSLDRMLLKQTLMAAPLKNI